MPAPKLNRQTQNTVGTLARRVYDGLCREITTGKLKPGELLSRRRVAAAYGTSYIPVIEAMLRLENAGLIEAESSQMARVCKVTVEAIENTYVLREALETQAIRLACASATDLEIAELYRLAEELEALIARLDVSRGTTSDADGPTRHWQFHRRIAEMSRCPALVRELDRIELQRRLRASWIFVEGKSDPPRNHARLVDAVKGRDADAADKVMRLHVRSGLEKELLGYRANSTTLNK